MRLLAADAGLRAVGVVECIAAGCGRGGGCAEGHGAVIDCAKEAFFAGQDLLDVGTGDVPRSFAAMLMRYLPGMYMQYGQGDKDVAKLEQMVRSSLSTSSQG